MTSFAFHPAASTAVEILTSWTKLFRWLPFFSCEPERAARMVDEFIAKQPVVAFEVPHCPYHLCAMVMLGSHERVKCAYGGQYGKSFRYSLYKGMFRCPTPGCARVEKLPELSDQVSMCPMCGEPTDAPLSCKVGKADLRCYSCKRERGRIWKRGQDRAMRGAA